MKKGIEYDATVDRSDAYLRKHVHEKQSMVVMYVDLVGSTDITLTLPEEKVAIIISSFAQEMAYAVNHHGGFVLKFVGDAVIGYFVHQSSLIAADNAIGAAKSMIKIIEEGINPILNQYDYPDLFVKIGIDFGTNMIVRYGSDAEKSYVDLLGPAMNIAAKIQGKAKPQEILIGEDVYNRIHPSLQKNFQKKYGQTTNGNITVEKLGIISGLLSFKLNGKLVWTFYMFIMVFCELFIHNIHHNFV